MAATTTGDRLTAQHRRAQAAIVTRLMRQVVALWPMLDLARLDETAPAWVAANTSLIRGGYTVSQRVAMEYLRAFRLAEGVTAVLPEFVLPEIAEAAVQTSLIVTGPVAVKRATANGMALEAAGRDALVQVSGSASRHMAAGGRDAVVAQSSADPRVSGWARVTGPDPCAFCLMLASRGAAYGSQESAGFEAHDHCWCWPEPAYDTADYSLPASVVDAQQAWESLRTSNGGPGAQLGNLRALVAERRRANA